MMPVMLVAFGTMLIIVIGSCKRQFITNTTTSTVNILEYLKQNADKYSLFTQIIEKAGYSSFLNAYGTNTIFAPTNDGVNAYLKKVNKATVNDIDEATAKNLVSFSLIQDTIATTEFSDGKLRTPTMLAQYLITGVANVNGTSTITINRQANLLQGNIRVGNGIIHNVDNMLVPATLTLAQLVEQDPRLSIFSEALKATGFYDSLNVPALNQTSLNRKYLTLVAQTNETFAAAGISDFAALKSKYSKTGNPKSPQDSLYLFVAYRVLPQLSYVSDIASSTSLPTLAPLEITTAQLEGEKVLLNNDTFNGVLEPGVELDRTLSDNSANNGVLHLAKQNYAIKIRKPTPVYFDVCDQPEIKRIPGLYRRPNKNFEIFEGELADVSWVHKGTAGRSVFYVTSALVTNDWFYGGDYMRLGFRHRANNDGQSAQTFRTPLIVKGRYKVWIDYRQSSPNSVVVSVDGVTLPNLVRTDDIINNTDSDALLESRGLKRYSDAEKADNSRRHAGRLAGVINITTTDRHTVTLSTNGVGGTTGFFLDVIEFRPIDMNQVLPRLGRDGTLKYE